MHLVAVQHLLNDICNDNIHEMSVYKIIVSDYIRYRLNKGGYNWDECPIDSTIDNYIPSKVQLKMRSMGDEFEEKYRDRFDRLGTQLQVTPDTAHQTFQGVVGELFLDGVKWGRIVAFFAFGGTLATHCYENNMSQLVNSIVDWMTEYLQEYLNDWIQSQGGWDTFVEHYEHRDDKQNDSLWPSVMKICGVAAGAIGVITLGAILSQKS